MHKEATKMRYNKVLIHVSALLAAACLLLCLTVSAFAEGGSGDGSGGGKDKPLTLESSSIANGAQNVPVNPEIVLGFSKNVVNISVKENNKNCFSMTDSKGNSVPVDIIMGDDQVNPTQEIKRTITVKPAVSLDPGETYLLKISGDVTAKSGAKIGKDNYISFTVAGATTTVTFTVTASETVTNTAVSTRPYSSTRLVSEKAVAVADTSRLLESSPSDTESETETAVSEQEETTAETESVTFSQTDAGQANESGQTNDIKKISPLPFILSVMGIAAIIAAILIIKNKKK